MKAVLWVTNDSGNYRDDSVNSLKWSDNQIDSTDKHNMMQGSPEPRPIYTQQHNMMQGNPEPRPTQQG